MAEIRTGREHLAEVLDCLRQRLSAADASIAAGAKEIEDMH